SAHATFRDRLYVQGGDLGGGNLVNQFYALDLSRSWHTTSPVWNTLPSGPINAYHSGGFSSDMNSFITFGREVGSPYTTPNFINIFSTSTGSWIGTDSAMVADPTRRDMAIASDPLPGGQIYFIGGDAGQSGAGRSNAFDVYNIQSSVVSETNIPHPGPQNIQGGTATWLTSKNAMILVGGVTDNAESNVVYLYKPSANMTTTSSYSNDNRINRRDYTSGSASGSPISSYNSGSMSSSSNLGSSAAWSAQATKGHFPSSRTAHCIASNEDGSIIAVFGGFVNRSSTSDHSIYFLDTRTWTWTMSSSNTVRGRSYSACTMSGNQFIVWGGFYSNPTSTPNNLPSIEESTMVYSLFEQGWVNTFVSRTAGSEGYGADSNSGLGNRGNDNSSDLSRPNNKFIGLVLAIACSGAIVALLITAGAIMIYRKRNQRRRTADVRSNYNSKNGDRPSCPSYPSSSTLGSGGGGGGRKKSLTGVWDPKSPLALENGVPGNATIEVTGHDDSHLDHPLPYECNPPASSYNTWEHTSPPVTTRREDVTLPSIGKVAYTETTIVTRVPPRINTSKSGPRSAPPISSPMSGTVTKHLSRGAEADVLAYQQQQRLRNHKQHQQQHPQNLEQEFEEKSQGGFFPISVEREYR
ncbi:hypothetical protein BGZ94_000249, partial [Podila epigama]